MFIVRLLFFFFLVLYKRFYLGLLFTTAFWSDWMWVIFEWSLNWRILSIYTTATHEPTHKTCLLYALCIVYRHIIRRTNKGNNTQNGDLMNELCGIGNSTQAILMLYTIYLRVNLHCNSCLGFMLNCFCNVLPQFDTGNS